jgi:hypothetical protein
MGYTLWVRERDVPPAPAENPELRHLEARRQVLYDNLKDLQFEFHQGKLSEQDYQSLKAGFLYDLASIMDSIERLQSGPAKQERAPAPKAKAQQANAMIACPSCASKNPAINRFCGSCGAALP